MVVLTRDEGSRMRVDMMKALFVMEWLQAHWEIPAVRKQIKPEHQTAWESHGS